jgi:hypothetical protein
MPYKFSEPRRHKIPKARYRMELTRFGGQLVA